MEDTSDSFFHEVPGDCIGEYCGIVKMPLAVTRLGCIWLRREQHIQTAIGPRFNIYACRKAYRKDTSKSFYSSIIHTIVYKQCLCSNIYLKINIITVNLNYDVSFLIKMSQRK